MAEKGPFPGMDPWLERNWRDVHASLIFGAKELLNRVMPTDLVARSDDRIYVDAEGDRVIEHLIKIIPADENGMITVIDFLSPASKRLGSDGRETYLHNRRKFLDEGCNHIEIDLIRAGDWIGLLWPHSVPKNVRTMYRGVIRRACRREEIEFHPIFLRGRLPLLFIPLRVGDSDIRLDLQSLFEFAFDSGRYTSTNYSAPPRSPTRTCRCRLGR